MSIVTTTPAFARTKCRACGQGFALGEDVTSQADGFRHIACRSVTRLHD